MFHLVTSS
jgi:hypothetical protein